MNKSAYAKAGVDIQKADVFVDAIAKMVKGTLNSNVQKSIGGYAALYRTGRGQFVAATTDGVGTKLKLAFELNRHDTVGIDLVAMSVNDLVCVGANPLFFLDYFATGRLELKTAQAVMKGIVEGCRQGHVALIGGETAEMPGMYADGEYDLAGFAVGSVSSRELIDGKSVRTGDVLMGLDSTGPHSNGFSLIRKLVRGKARDRKFMEQCLAPTRIYVKPVLALHQALGRDLKGLAHITGSGFLNIPRISENVDYRLQYESMDEIPPVFHELKKRGNLSWKELFTTFNMGIGMVCVVSPGQVSRFCRIMAKSGVGCRVVGEVVRSNRARTGTKKAQPTVQVIGPDFEVTLQY